MPDLDSTFTALEEIMKKASGGLEALNDEPGYLYFKTTKVDAKKKPIFFGMVKTGKGKVSYHLMPLYTDPELLDGMSEGLKARMQGKSCFNFSKVDTGLIDELGSLTQRCLTTYMETGRA